MSHPVLSFSIEPMTLADIPAVVAIEHASYSMTWPAKAYDYELQDNDLAHYFVLRTSLSHPPQEKSKHFNHLLEVQEEISSSQQSAVGGQFCSRPLPRAHCPQSAGAAWTPTSMASGVST